MQHRSVNDVTTREVVTARPDTPSKEVAGLFHRNDITAIPVVAVHHTLDWIEDDTEQHLEHPRAYRAAT
ncbi:CBS domain-containing protein [Streptomyces sp. Y1]|uniref:CBS domain-containing protein n=1 Tax=Streptomyces sp. Y1 TaxID=3238634 RepID=A0AB39TWF1_9ACTN